MLQIFWRLNIIIKNISTEIKCDGGEIDVKDNIIRKHIKTRGVWNDLLKHVMKFNIFFGLNKMDEKKFSDFVRKLVNDFKNEREGNNCKNKNTQIKKWI